MTNDQYLQGRGRRRRAFTLIELLVVMSIMVVVMTAILACIAGGIRVWDTARTFDVVESEAVIAFRILERDVMRTFRFFVQPFEGEVTRVCFPGLISASLEGGEGLSDERRIGSIEYRLEQQTRRLVRTVTVFPGGAGREETILEDVGSLKMDYYEAAVPDVSEGRWRSEWSHITNFPERVRVSVELGTGEKSLNLERVILLAVSNPEKEVQ